MMHRKHIYFVILILLILAMLSACSNNVTSTPSESPSASSPSVPSPSVASPSPTHFLYTAPPSPSPIDWTVPTPSPSPKVNYTVKTDYSQLTPYEPPEEICTRLSKDYMPELIPSDDYGMLVPYAGKVIDSWMGSFYYYGLMTTDGMIVTDAVYADVYRESDFYILYQPTEVTAPEGYQRAERRYAMCALDGSWTTPFDSEEIFCCDEVMLLVRDSSTNDIDVMDYSGNLLYNTKSIDSIAKLPPYTIYNPNDEMSYNELEYGDGYIAVINESDYGDDPGISFYIEELTGRVINTDFTRIRGFNGGFAAVEKDGLWGYIDTSLTQVIAPTYEAAGDFDDGKAIVLLASGEDAVIDTNGNVLLKTKNDLTYYSGFFIVRDADNRKAVIYDSNLNEVFKSDGNDMLSIINDSDNATYSYVKNGKTTIVTTDSVTTIPGSYDINQMNDHFIYCSMGEDDDRIVKHDGTLIAKLEPENDGYTSVHFVNQNYIIVNYYNYDDYYNLTGKNYQVLDNEGNTIFSSKGTVAFNYDTGYFEIYADDYFACIDTSGKYIFKISFMDDLPD